MSAVIGCTAGEEANLIMASAPSPRCCGKESTCSNGTSEVGVELMEGVVWCGEDLEP